MALADPSGLRELPAQTGISSLEHLGRLTFFHQKKTGMPVNKAVYIPPVKAHTPFFTAWLNIVQDTFTDEKAKLMSQKKT